MKNSETIASIFIAILIGAAAVMAMLRIVANFIKAHRENDKETQTEILRQIIFSLVTEAERALGGGTGQLKLSTVIKWVYERIPDTIKPLFTLDDITSLVEEVLTEAKEYWEANKSARDYIDCWNLTAELLEAPTTIEAVEKGAGETQEAANASDVKEPAETSEAPLSEADALCPASVDPGVPETE